MGRVSQAQAQENRRRIVETAARLFRERGVGQVSVADVMAAVGRTHGGFYKHFASKDALVAEAVGLAFTERRALLEKQYAPWGEKERGRFLDAYFSPVHRDSPGDGCPCAGFGGDLARAEANREAREPYAEGVEGYARQLGALTAVSTRVGALILARATAGTELSDRILAEARDALERGGR